MLKNKVLNMSQPLPAMQIFEVLGEKCESVNDIDPYMQSVAGKILLNFNRYSDLLLFLQSAASRKEIEACYQLFPPHTVAKDDVEFLCRILIKIGVLDDALFSQTNDAYLLRLNPYSPVSISKLLTLGCIYCLLRKKQCDLEVFYQEKAILFYEKAGLTKYNVELAAGLDYNVVSSTAQMKSLIKKITHNSEGGIHQVFIVSDHVKSILPLWDNVISISELIEPVCL